MQRRKGPQQSVPSLVRRSGSAAASSPSKKGSTVGSPSSATKKQSVCRSSSNSALDVAGMLRISSILSALVDEVEKAEDEMEEEEEEETCSSDDESDDDDVAEEEAAAVPHDLGNFAPAFGALPHEVDYGPSHSPVSVPSPLSIRRQPCSAGSLIPSDPTAADNLRRLTVVLDLDETLGAFRVEPASLRPHLTPFFRTLEQYDCEVVVWTAAVHQYAEFRLAGINGLYIHHLIGRDPRWFTDVETHAKDLRLLRRDLSRCLIVENSPNPVRFQPGNAILVQNWTHEVATQLQATCVTDESMRYLSEIVKIVAQRVAADPEATVPNTLAMMPEYVDAGTVIPGYYTLKYVIPGVPRQYGTPQE